MNNLQAAKELLAIAKELSYMDRVEKAFNKAMAGYMSYYTYPQMSPEDREAGYGKWIEYAKENKAKLEEISDRDLSYIALKIVQQA